MDNALLELDRAVENRLRSINGEIILKVERYCDFEFCECSKIIEEQRYLKDFLYYKDSKQYIDFSVRYAYKKRIRETYNRLKEIETKPCGFCRLCQNLNLGE